MKAISQEYFHVRRIDPNKPDWSASEIQYCFKESNYFFTRIMKGGYGYNDGSGFLFTRRVLQMFITSDKVYKNKHEVEIFKLCNSVIDELTITIREITFEIVRQKYFKIGRAHV